MGGLLWWLWRLQWHLAQVNFAENLLSWRLIIGVVGDFADVPYGNVVRGAMGADKGDVRIADRLVKGDCEGTVVVHSRGAPVREGDGATGVVESERVVDKEVHRAPVVEVRVSVDGRC